MQSLEKLIGTISPVLANLTAELLVDRAMLVDLQAAHPEMAEAIAARIANLDVRIEALRTAHTPEGLAALGKTVFDELLALPKTGIKPAVHASDSAAH